ncbi:MAG: sugar phosphate isomerase/epimerase [bacterium]
MSFKFALNTSTIRGQGLNLQDEIAVVKKAGYDGIEPWISEIDSCVASGVKLKDIGKKIADAGLAVPNLIGFFEWSCDDDAKRARGLIEARRNFEIAQKVGSQYLAAPPFGLEPDADLRQVATRYADLLAIGREYGVVPILEFWGAVKKLNRMSEALFVAAECGDRDAIILADVFHMYKSGSGHNSLKLIGPSSLGLLHLNDYPGDIPLNIINDSDRVYPGDGVAPLKQILTDLQNANFGGMLSIELFNGEYYEMDALYVAKTALEKSKKIAGEI